MNLVSLLIYIFTIAMSMPVEVQCNSLSCIITFALHSHFAAKNLLLGMLKVDPAYRRTAKEILNHPWITVSFYPIFFLYANIFVGSLWI